eukprot:665430-Lingulodinium_polyedra.AAC.1
MAAGPRRAAANNGTGRPATTPAPSPSNSRTASGSKPPSACRASTPSTKESRRTSTSSGASR